MRSIALLALVTVGVLNAAEFEVASIKANPSLPLMKMGPEVEVHAGTKLPASELRCWAF